MLKKIIKLFNKLTLPLTILTLITFAILLYASLNSGNASLISILSIGFVMSLVDFLGELQNRKNAKSLNEIERYINANRKK